MFTEILPWCIAHYYWFLVVVVYLTYIRYGTGLSKYRGPFLASLTNWWRFYDVAIHRHDPPMVKLHMKYGSIVRYGPNMLSFSDPRAIKDIYLGADAFPKSEYYSVGDLYVQGVKHSTVFSTRDDIWHGKMRRGFGPAFSMTAIVQLEDYVDQTIDIFLKNIASRSADRKGPDGRVNLVKSIQYFAFDVLGQLLYGERHGFIDTDSDIGGINAFVDFGLHYTYVIGQIPWLDKFFLKNPLLVWLSNKGYIDTGFVVIPFAIKHITERADREKKIGEDGEPTGDLLDRMLALQEKDPEFLNDVEVVKMCAMFVFAGSDTTAITVSALFCYLLKNPQIYAKLQSEIDAAIPTLELRIPYAKAQALPYLDACLKETFRIHPASGFNIERVVPVGGGKVMGEFIPGGTIVSMNGWAVHRNKEVFGNDVEVFRPERWLEDKEKANEMWKYMFHFGAGSRLCIGKNIALLEMYKLVPVFLRNFKMELEDPKREWILDNTTFVKPTNCDVRLRRR